MADRTDASPQQRYGQKPTPGASEYSWGAGLTPPGLENASPDQGGRYRGLTPPMGEPAGLRALADALAERATYGGA